MQINSSNVLGFPIPLFLSFAACSDVSGYLCNDYVLIANGMC